MRWGGGCLAAVPCPLLPASPHRVPRAGGGVEGRLVWDAAPTPTLHCGAAGTSTGRRAMKAWARWGCSCAGISFRLALRAIGIALSSSEAGGLAGTPFPVGPSLVQHLLNSGPQWGSSWELLLGSSSFPVSRLGLLAILVLSLSGCGCGCGARHGQVSFVRTAAAE